MQPPEAPHAPKQLYILVHDHSSLPPAATESAAVEAGLRAGGLPPAASSANLPSLHLVTRLLSAARLPGPVPSAPVEQARWPWYPHWRG